MDTSETSVKTGIDGEVHVIVTTLHGVPVVIRVARPERFEAALRDAKSTAAQVASGNLYWCDGVRHLIRFSNYYSAPLPHHSEHELSLHHMMEIGAHVGSVALHAPVAIAHYVHDHLPRHRAH